MFDLEKELGESIRYYRMTLPKNQRSQNRVGKKIGVSGQQIKHYENGRGKITLDRLFALAKVFGVSVTKILPKQLKRK